MKYKLKRGKGKTDNDEKNAIYCMAMLYAKAYCRNDV